MAQTMEQKRAAYAFQRASFAKGLPGKTPQKYKRLAKGLPQMIMVSGLMPVLAFLNEKGEEHHRQIYTDLSQWLVSRGVMDKAIPLAAIMQTLTSSSSLQYQERTSEALAILKWLRQLASAVIEGDD